jgi:hypothetical protein
MIALACSPVHADGTPAGVPGSVVSLDGSTLVVHAKDGNDVSINLGDKLAVLAVVTSSIGDIKPGMFIVTSTVTQPDSSLRSQEVRRYHAGPIPIYWTTGLAEARTRASRRRSNRELCRPGLAGTVCFVSYDLVSPCIVAAIDDHSGCAGNQ